MTMKMITVTSKMMIKMAKNIVIFSIEVHIFLF